MVGRRIINKNDVQVIVLHFTITVQEVNHDHDVVLPATELKPHDDNKEWQTFSLYLNGNYDGLNAHKENQR